MRKFALFCIIALAPVMVPAAAHAAFTYEVHPGIYNSYEYTDNYYGSIRDEQSESTYLVGPSLNITAVSPTINLGFTGRYAKSFHKRFSEDDSPEIHLLSNASYTTPRQDLLLTYEFTRSLTRESLSEPFGDARIHDVRASSSWMLGQRTSLDVGYTFSAERWTDEAVDEEDITTHGGNLGCTYSITPASRITMTIQQLRHDYEVSENVIETSGSLRGEHDVSPVLILGLVSSFNNEDRDVLPGADRYDARLTGRYIFPNEITLSVEGGYQWYVMEDQDRETGYACSASLVKDLDNDQLTLSVVKEYTSDFTANRYGTYDTTSGSFEWNKVISRGFSSTAHCNIERLKPVSGTDDEDQTDMSAGLSLEWNPVVIFALSWDPIEAILVTLTYDYLRTEYETSGTARENRYMMGIEVRY